MMSISQLARSIKEPPTLALNDKACQLRESGKAVIHLGAGEPKSKTPLDAIVNCIAKLVTADIRYTPTRGIMPLIKAVINYTEENYNKSVGPNNVIVSNGAKHSLYNAMMSIIDPGDEVIIPAPYWVSYPEIARMAYGIPVIIDPEDGQYIPTMENINKAANSKTKAIIINSPNNPSGLVYPESLIGELVEFCEKKDIYLIMDDIYHKLVFDGMSAVSCYKYSKEDINSSKLIVLNGVSKLYAMTGFRIGWAVASSDIIAAMANVQVQNISCASVVTQSAAVGALTGIQSGTENLRSTLQKNRDIMMAELDSFKGVRTAKPEGTFYCLPDFRAYSNDSVALSKFLLEKALVVAIPGGEFGMEGHLRLSFCGSAKEITEGVARIKWALDSDSPDEIYIGDKKCKRDWQRVAL
jgi:aspartate aminotransferase